MKKTVFFRGGEHREAGRMADQQSRQKSRSRRSIFLSASTTEKVAVMPSPTRSRPAENPYPPRRRARRIPWSAPGEIGGEET